MDNCPPTTQRNHQIRYLITALKYTCMWALLNSSHSISWWQEANLYQGLEGKLEVEKYPLQQAWKPPGKPGAGCVRCCRCRGQNKPHATLSMPPHRPSQAPLYSRCGARKRTSGAGQEYQPPGWQGSQSLLVVQVPTPMPLRVLAIDGVFLSFHQNPFMEALSSSVSGSGSWIFAADWMGS